MEDKMSVEKLVHHNGWYLFLSLYKINFDHKISSYKPLADLGIKDWESYFLNEEDDPDDPAIGPEFLFGAGKLNYDYEHKYENFYSIWWGNIFILTQSIEFTDEYVLFNDIEAFEYNTSAKKFKNKKLKTNFLKIIDPDLILKIKNTIEQWNNEFQWKIDEDDEDRVMRFSFKNPAIFDTYTLAKDTTELYLNNYDDLESIEEISKYWKFSTPMTYLYRGY